MPSPKHRHEGIVEQVPAFEARTEAGVWPDRQIQLAAIEQVRNVKGALGRKIAVKRGAASATPVASAPTSTTAA